jgi:hypothetical protein
MAELKNIRIAVSGLYDYALEEIPTLRIPMPGAGAPDWVEEKRLYKVYRPAPVLAVACPKFANLPMTHHHPKAPVDGQNFRDLAIGWTGEHPEVDYIPETNEVGIKSTCVLYDDEALDAYERGEIQLSPGYIAVFEWQKGTTPAGEEYDIIMKEITDVNHLALLPNGRGGEYAVVMDEAAKEPSVFDLVRESKDGAPKGEERESQILSKIKKAGVLMETASDDGTVHDNRVADTTRVVSLNINDDPPKVKSIFEIAAGSVFDRVRNK